MPDSTERDPMRAQLEQLRAAVTRSESLTGAERDCMLGTLARAIGLYVYTMHRWHIVPRGLPAHLVRRAKARRRHGCQT